VTHSTCFIGKTVEVFSVTQPLPHKHGTQKEAAR